MSKNNTLQALQKAINRKKVNPIISSFKKKDVDLNEKKEAISIVSAHKYTEIENKYTSLIVSKEEELQDEIDLGNITVKEADTLLTLYRNKISNEILN